MRIAVATNWPARPVDGIRDYSVRLTAALAEAGADAYVLGRERRNGWRRSRAAGGCAPLEDAVAGADALLLQYNPFNFGRYGFAPWLPLSLARLRRRPGRPVIAATVHEREIYPIATRRAALMAAWQRRQLTLCWPSLDVAFACVGVIARELRLAQPARPVTHLPVASNLPDAREQRDVARAELGAGAGTLVVAAFGTDHPSRRAPHLRAAVAAVARETERVVVLNLGARAPALGELPGGVRELRPGERPAHEIARRLAAADLFLAPFSDGVSTRRTTVMAALQHGVAVVGTSGVWTDDVLLGGGPVLVPASDARAFAAAAAELAADPPRRAAAGEAGRRLYEREFDWPLLARRVVAGLEACG